MKLVQVEDPAVGSFDLEDGEVGVLLGRSGAGKTVLIKNLLGLDRRQIARLLIDRAVVTVEPGGDRARVRVEWSGGAELTRLAELKDCPRLWANRARLARLRKPSPRG